MKATDDPLVWRYARDNDFMKHVLLFIFIFCAFSNSVFGQVNTDSVLSEAVRLRTENRCDEAIAKLNKAIESESKNAWLYIERARCFRSLKNNDALLSDVQNAFRFGSADKSFDRLLEIGEIELRASGQSEEVIKIADSLIANNTAVARAYEIRGLNKLVLKNYVGAIDDYLKFSELDPFLAESGRIGIILTSLGELKNDKNIFSHYERVINFYVKLLKNLNDSLQNKPQNEYKPNYQIYKSRVSSVTNRYGAVVQALSMDLADLYLAKGETEKAEDVLDKMVQTEPKILAYGYRLQYYKRKGKFEEAADDLTIQTELLNALTESQGRKVNPKFKAKFLISRGDLYVLAQKYEKAIADYESAIQNDPEIASEANEKISVAKQKQRK
jgi:tetratricopeptide (TPR) repeat protein